MRRSYCGVRLLLSSQDTPLLTHTLYCHQTCEIAGDDSSPHASIGSARWMPVGKPGMQAQILREAVENQTPDIIICDEISTRWASAQHPKR